MLVAARRSKRKERKADRQQNLRPETNDHKTTEVVAKNSQRDYVGKQSKDNSGNHPWDILEKGTNPKHKKTKKTDDDSDNPDKDSSES